MIKSNLRVLIAQKEQRENIKLPYRAISEQTDLAVNTIYLLVNNKAKMVSMNTLDRLCAFFDCTPSDILLYIPDEFTRAPK